MTEGTPAPPHPPSMAATELTHATASRDCQLHTPGRTGCTPSPPGHSRRLPCSSSVLHGCMGEDLSQPVDPTAGVITAQF